MAGLFKRLFGQKSEQTTGAEASTLFGWKRPSKDFYLSPR